MLNLTRDDTIVKPLKQIIIGVEGDNTEKFYFDIFKNNPEIELVTIQPNSQSSFPQVYSKINEIRKNNSYNNEPLKKTTELWTVCDVDQNFDEGTKLNKTKSCFKDANLEINNKKINITISNECFEVWLLFHFKDIKFEELTKSRSELKKIFKRKLQKLKENHTEKLDVAIKKYLPLEIKTAINASKEFYTIDEDKMKPKKPGTDVFKLIESITQIDKRFF